ncbi:MAG: preprotein translocase subunit SecE [Actinomycetota bacterium]|nr:preprotein translocase subunit SecE [Actinomycetota bacterium]
MSDKKAGKSKGIDSAKRFFKDVRIELGKVIWPGREEVVASTIVVIAAVAFFAIFIGIIDLIFVTVIKLISV